MSPTPPPHHQASSEYLTQLPIRLYGALRNLRIYPPANPQVKKGAQLVLDILTRLFQLSSEVTVAVAEHKLLVNGQPLSEKDQARPQVTGIVELFEKLSLHSIMFYSYISTKDYARFMQLFTLTILDTDQGKKTSLKDKLTEEGITAVTIDETRYVAVSEGEQVISEEELSRSGLMVSDDDLALYILNQGNTPPASNNISLPELQQLLAGLPRTNNPDQQPRSLQESLNSLFQLLENQEQSPDMAVKSTAANWSRLPPDILAHLLSRLPQHELADQILDQTVNELDDVKILQLLSGLLVQSNQQPEGNTNEPEQLSLIDRLRRTSVGSVVNKQLTNYTWAGLLNDNTPESEIIPTDLKQKLNEPEWAVPILMAGMQQIIEQQRAGNIPHASDNLATLFSRFETAVDNPEKQQRIINQAADKIVSMEDRYVGQILVQRFKGLFGEQLYSRVIEQMSDERIQQLADDLQKISRDPTRSPIDDQELQETYNYLLKSVREQKIRTVIDLHKNTGRQQQLASTPSQINASIDALIRGDHSVLADATIALAIPVHIKKLLQRKNDRNLDMLLGQLVAGLQSKDESLSFNAAQGLAGTMQILAKHGQWQRMTRLLPAIERVLRIAVTDTMIIGKSIAALTKLVSFQISQEQFGAARDALMCINNPAMLSTATLVLREHAELATNMLVSKQILRQLLHHFFQDDERSEEAGRLLAAFGSNAADFLMEQLSQSENKDERIALLQLIEDIGAPAEEALRGALQQPAPWYVSRNIIRLLANIGNPDCFDEIAPYIKRDDIRIKQEVLNAVGKIGGTNKKQFLLKALRETPRQLTGQVVELLGDIPDDRLVVPLADLLDKTSMFQSKRGNELQISICKALGKIGSIKALPTLKSIIQNHTTPGVPEEDLLQDPILQAAKQAVRTIKNNDGQRIQLGKSKKIMGVSVETDPVAIREAAIFRIALTGEKERASEMLFHLIRDCAASHDFENAERLRERFYEIDSTALADIIRSDEIIEREKHGVTGRSYLDVWADLLDELSAEEFSSIYHELENITLESEEILVSQGDKNDELFFINQGSLKVIYAFEGREIFIKNLASGEIAGENFFEASHWTVTIISLTPCRISSLQRASFSRWQEEFPGLENKLHRFYKRSNNIHELLNKKGLNRREYDRYKINRRVQVQMTVGTGRPIGRSFQGDLFDISRGGLALVIRIAKKENGRLLLGRNMRITVPTGGEQEQLHLHGQSLAIHPSQQNSDEVLVHLTYHEHLDKDTLQIILG